MRWKMQTLAPILIATGMCLFGLVVLCLQVFVWHHFKVVTVVGAAFLSTGVCILYDDLFKARRSP